eukprot:9833236-Ditylum_brightwellii.AAC.1
MDKCIQYAKDGKTPFSAKQVLSTATYELQQTDCHISLQAAPLAYIGGCDRGCVFCCTHHRWWPNPLV